MSGNDEEIRVALTADPSELAAGYEEAADVAEESQQRMAASAADAAAQMKASAVAVGESQAEAAARIKLMVQNSLAAAAANEKQQVSERALMEAQGMRVEATEAQIAAAAAYRAEQEAQMVPMDAYIGATATATAETEANTAATVENEAAQAGLNEKIASGAAVREYSALVDEALRGRYSQMTGTVATLSNRLGFMSALFSPMGAAIAGAAGVVGIFTAALVKGTEEEEGFERAVLSSNGAIGVTADRLHDMAGAIVGDTITMGTAVEAITKVAQSGRYAGDQIQYIGEAAANMSAVTGESLQKAIGAFNSLQDEPLKAAVKLNEQYHFLTQSTYDQIAAFEALGEKEAAAKVAQDALASDMNQNARTMYDQESNIAKGWDAVKDAISGAWDALKMWASTDTYKEQIEALDRQISDLQSRATGANTLTGLSTHMFDAQIQQLKNEKLALQNIMAEQNREAANKGAAANQVTDHIDYAQSQAKAKQHEDKLTEIHGNGDSQRHADSERVMKQVTSDLDTETELQADRYQMDVAAKERALQQKLSLGDITKQQELQGLMDLENQKYQYELQSLNDQIALQPEDTEAYNKLLLKKEQLLMAHAQKVGEIQDQLTQDQVNRYKAMLAPIDAAINQSVNGIIQGTTTGKQALSRLAMSVVDEFIAARVKIVSDWLAGEAAKTFGTEAGNTARTASDETAAALSKTTAVAGATTAITANAAQAASGAAASVSAIPVVGWAMALEVGAATLAAVLAYKGLASASGGWGNVPEETWTLLHPNEMVLPAPIAEGARNMFKAAAGGEQGGSGRGAPDVHIHTMDASSLRDLLRRNPRIIGEAVAHAGRMYRGR